MSILDDILRDIEESLESALAIAQSHTLPLTGQPKVEFEAAIDAAGENAVTALEQAFFDGIDGAVLEPPSPSGQLAWWIALAAEAIGIANVPAPTTAQKQTAANDLATMGDGARRAAMLAEYV